MNKVNYQGSKYYHFFQEAAKIYNHSGGHRLLLNSIERVSIFPKRLTWEEWRVAASILSSFLSSQNNNSGGDRRLFGISELHIEDLVKQCEEAERPSINNPLQQS